MPNPVAFSSYRPFIWERSFERTAATEVVQLTGAFVFIVNGVSFSYPIKLIPYRRDDVAGVITTFFKIDPMPFIRQNLEPFKNKLPSALLRLGGANIVNYNIVTESYGENTIGFVNLQAWKVGSNGILIEDGAAFEDVNANKNEVYFTNTIKGNGIDTVSVLGNGEDTRSYQEYDYYTDDEALNLRTRLPFTKWKVDAEPQDQGPFVFLPIRKRDRFVVTMQYPLEAVLTQVVPTLGQPFSFGGFGISYLEPIMNYIGPWDLYRWQGLTEADLGRKYIITSQKVDSVIGKTKIYGFEIVPSLRDDLVIRWYNDEGGVDYWLFRNARKTQGTDKQVGSRNLDYRGFEGYFAQGVQQLNESERQRFTLETTEVIRWEVVNNVPREFAEYVSGINTSPCVYIEDNDPIYEVDGVTPTVNPQVRLTPVECIEISKQDLTVGLKHYTQFKFTFEASVSNPTHTLN